MKRRKKPVEEVNLVSALLDPNKKLDAVARVDPLGVIERSRFIDVSVRAARWAEVVHSHGLARGEHVVVLADRDGTWRAALLGVIESGCVAVPLSGAAAVDDVHAVASDAGAALVLAPHARPDLDDGPAVVSVDEVDVPRVRPAVRPGEPAQAMPPDAPALVLYTRDGAGWRGATHTHGSLLAQAVAGERWLGLGAGDSVWSTAQDGSAESIWLLLAAWHAGAEVIVVDHEGTAEVVLELLHRLQPSAVWLSNDEYLQLARSDVPDWLDLRSIRRALTVDAGSPGVVAFHETFGTAVAPVLGSLEAGMVAGCATESGDEPAAFRGIGLTVVDGEGRELRAGEVGELAVSGAAPSLFAGYGRERSEAPKPGEWFRLGRRGAIDPDGLLRLAPDEQPQPIEPEDAPVGDEDAGVAAHVVSEAPTEEDRSRARKAAAAEERRRAEQAEQAKREASAAKEALRAEEAERAAREAEQRRRADELLRLEEERRRREEHTRETAKRAADDGLAPGIASMIDHYGFAGARADPDSRRESTRAEQTTAFEDRATDSS